MRLPSAGRPHRRQRCKRLPVHFVTSTLVYGTLKYCDKSRFCPSYAKGQLAGADDTEFLNLPFKFLELINNSLVPMSWELQRSLQ